jgi:hypothetical protein
MTLRQALLEVDLNKVYKLIHKKNLKNVAECDRPQLNTVINQYSKVVEELLSLKCHKSYKYPWYIKYEEDWYQTYCKEHNEKYDGDGKYISVCLYNPHYVKPDSSLKPYGRMKKEKIPKGHYDCNADKHQEFFAAGFTSWNNVIDSEVIISIKISRERAIAELLWELTFYGWTNKKVKENCKKLQDSLEESLKNMESGKSKSYTAEDLNKLIK